MTRASLDFYETGRKAFEHAADLCVVGLRRGDVAAIWALGPPTGAWATPDPAPPHAIDSELGRLGLTGWLADSLGTRVGQVTLADIHASLNLAGPSVDEIRRIEAVLSSGGGIVIVRAPQTGPTVV